MRTVHGVGFDYRINTDQEYTVIKMKILLQHRILLGYTVLIAVIGSMAAIMFHERDRVGKIEGEMLRVREAHRSINAAHRHITVLATYGESAISWTADDYESYKAYRLKTDSLLQSLKSPCSGFVRPEQIDTLCRLLAQKEKQLHGIMRVMHRQDASDSLLLHRPPSATRPAMRTRTVTRRKKGLAGLFGKKETVQVHLSPGSLQSLNTRLVSLQRERREDIGSHTDSLRIRNRELNGRLHALITALDGQTEEAFLSKQEQLRSSFEESMMRVTVLIASSVLLLAFSYLKIHRDIKVKASGRKQLEEHVEKLQQAVKENEELISNRHRIMQTITHELRTPLSTIIGYAEMATQETDSAIAQDYARKALLASRRMISMLNTMLGYFRLDCGKEQANPVPFSLRNISDTLQAEFAPLAANKSLKLVVELEGNEVLFGDKERIMQVGDNLLSNAVKFTESGSVTLRVDYGGGNLHIVVEDTGSGMSREEQARIFNAFEQLPNAASQEGFGLGLSIVQRIVGMLKGTIDVESIKGKGTRFSVSLPMGTADEIPAGVPETVPAACAGTLFSVIVLDDNESLLSMTREMLVRNGIRCDVANNTGDLMESIRNRGYDLLITDLKMPGTSGYDVLELLRSSNVGNSKDIPVVVATASTGYGKEELVGMGFTDVLFKPFSMQELMRVCESCIPVRIRAMKPDFSTLLSYGNEATLLDKLAEATEEEMRTFREAAGRKDTETLRVWLHHLRSSWMVLRTEAPLQRLQVLLAAGAPDEEEVHRAVTEILETGDTIMRLAREERRKYGGKDNRN